MGYISVMGPCWACGRVFSFSPTKVPSFPDPATGHREPVCESCMLVVNQRRIASGQPPFKILPGAYEADDESEVD